MSRRVALVADDHQLFRAGLAGLLARDFGFAEVVEANSFDETVACLEKVETTICCLDLDMPGFRGASSLHHLRVTFPAARLVVVTGSTKREDILSALQAGVHGYVPKSLGLDEMTRALHFVLGGQVYVPPCLTDPVRDDVVTLVPSENEPAAELPQKDIVLTPRQRDVLRLIAAGKSNKGIARALDLSEGTVKVHVNALFRTLGVNNRVSAICAISRVQDQ